MTTEGPTSSPSAQPAFVGVDVAKDKLDLARSDRAGQAWRFDNTPAGVAQLVASLKDANPATVAVEANSGLMIVEAVINGLGIGELPVHMAQEIPQLVRIWPKQEEGYDIWLVMHADLHRTARVRAVADVIVEAFAQAY